MELKKFPFIKTTYSAKNSPSSSDLSFRPFVFLPICLSVNFSLCPFVFLSICLSVNISLCPFVFLSICLSVRLSLCLFASRSICLTLLCLSNLFFFLIHSPFYLNNYDFKNKEGCFKESKIYFQLNKTTHSTNNSPFYLKYFFFGSKLGCFKEIKNKFTFLKQTIPLIINLFHLYI